MAEIQAFQQGDQKGEDWWKDVVIPFGHQQGTRLGDLEKKKLFGWVANYEVEEIYNGNRKSDDELAVLRHFREALDAANEKYAFTKHE